MSDLKEFRARMDLACKAIMREIPLVNVRDCNKCEHRHVCGAKNAPSSYPDISVEASLLMAAKCQYYKEEPK